MIRSLERRSTPVVRKWFFGECVQTNRSLERRLTVNPKYISNNSPNKCKTGAAFNSACRTHFPAYNVSKKIGASYSVWQYIQIRFLWVKYLFEWKPVMVFDTIDSSGRMLLKTVKRSTIDNKIYGSRLAYLVKGLSYIQVWESRFGTSTILFWEVRCKFDDVARYPVNL